jgi:hypothetical protein
MAGKTDANDKEVKNLIGSDLGSENEGSQIKRGEGKVSRKVKAGRLN